MSVMYEFFNKVYESSASMFVIGVRDLKIY